MNKEGAYANYDKRPGDLDTGSSEEIPNFRCPESQGNAHAAAKRDGGKDSQAKVEGSNPKKKTFVEQLDFKAPDLKVQMIN